MKYKKMFLLLFGSFLTSISLITFTHAFFSNQKTSSNNSFSAIEVFPTFTPSPIPSNIANHLVISEVQINGGPSRTTRDFIEIHNPTDKPIDLDGYRLVKRSGNSNDDMSIKSWTSSAIIPSHGFYLWASNDDDIFPSSIGADASTSATLSTSDNIAIRQGAMNTGVIVDSLGWNNGASFVEGNAYDTNPGPNQSLERRAYATSTKTTMTNGSDALKGNGFDTNNNLNDFVLRDSSQPQNSFSPTETP